MRQFTFGVLLAVMSVCFSSPAFAQQEKGDKEIGVSGSALVTNAKPVTGSFDLQGNFGVFFTQKQYLGLTVGPSLTFGGGTTTGSLLYSGEYKYLFGHKNSRVFPFLGVLGGGETDITKSTGIGATGTTTTTNGFAAPEFGVRIYASRKSAFDVTYQLLVAFGSGLSGASFGQRSLSYVTFGFKHLF